LLLAGLIINGPKQDFKGIWPEITIGLSDEGIICGPVSVVKAKAKKFFILKPGSISPGKIAKRLMELFDDKSLRSEDLLQFIPSDSMIEIN
jgi:hypothetical protein